MFKHKLFDLLKTFDENEIKILRSYLNSPYFNHSKKLSKLFGEIIKYYPSFDRENLTKQDLCRKIYRKHNFDDAAMRNDLSELLKLTEDFLITENFRNERYNKFHFLLKSLINKGNSSLFIKALKSVDEDLSILKSESSVFFYNKYLIEAEKFNFSYSHEKIIKEFHLDAEIEHVTKAGIYLSMFYITEIISAYFNIIFYSDDFKINKFLNPLHKLVNNVSIENMIRIVNKGNEYSFILGIYYALLKSFSNFENEKCYFKYKLLINKYSTRISRDELYFHYNKFIAYCLLKLTFEKHTNKFSIELFNIYKEIIEKEYFINNKTKLLSKDLYRNIIIHGLRVKKFVWIENFIKKYSSYLPLENRDSMYNYGFAYLYNSSCKFSKSLEFCNKIKLDHFIYKYDIKNLTLKNYYELNYFEESLSLIDSYRHFLNNDKLLANIRKNRYKLFIYYLEKLILIKYGKQNINLKDLKKRLKLENQIAFKDWLIARYNQILI